MRFAPRLAFGIPLLLLSAAGLIQAVVWARADLLARQDTVAALDAALRLAPGNAEYHARIAELDPARTADLATALHLNPRQPSWWILLAVHQEEDDDLAAAERSLLQANAVSLYYVPRWSLAAFYFRQQNRAEFLRWGKLALSPGAGTVDSLVRMAQRLGVGPGELLQELIPRNIDRVNAYLGMAMADGDMDGTFRAAMEAVDLGTAADRSTVLRASEALFGANRLAQAVALWNRILQAGWAPGLETLDPQAGRVLGDGSFARMPVEAGFDWRYPAIAGVSTAGLESDGSLRLDFSGSQPENCELASQPVALLPDKRYRLTVQYRTERLGAGNGLQWRVQGADGKAEMTGVLDTAPKEFAEQTFSFRTQSEQVPRRLVLAYTRSPGTKRIEGTLWVKSAALEVER